MIESLYSWYTYLIPHLPLQKLIAQPPTMTGDSKLEKKSKASPAGESSQSPSKPAAKSRAKIDPARAKIDPLFWTTYQSHLRKSLSMSRRIQAFDTTVFITPPGINVAEQLFVNEDGISVSVHDGQEHNIPDMELYTARLEELSKHSAEVTSLP